MRFIKKASIRIQDFLDNNPHLVKIQNHPNS